MPKEYQVGYGKPPKSGQFKKGQSGNRDGRPKKASKHADLQAGVLAMLDSKVSVTFDGQKKEVTVAEAMIVQLRNDILTGTPVERARAIKLLKEICPDYNVPGEFDDAPTEINVRLVESDNYGNEFDPDDDEKRLLKAIWRQARDGGVALTRIVEKLEKKLQLQLIDPLRRPAGLD
ncbi:MAG: DUF5681 domain-containing protein [Pseudomonadota bacterium]